MEISIRDLIEKNISGEWGTEPTNESAVKVIRTANFTNSGILNLDNIVYRSIEEKKIENKKLLRGDIIIEKSGGSPNQPVGRVIYFDEEDLFLTNNFTSILRAKRKIVFPKYLFYALFNLHSQGKTLKHQNKTTGIINLKLTDYLKEKIPLPSYENQIKIANLLERIETLIAERQNTIDLLDELVKATFYQMFGDPVKNEKGWDKDILSSLGSIDRGVSKHRPRNASELLGGIYPLVQTGDVSRAGLWLKEYTQTYSELGLKQSKLWQKGTLLITIAANIANTSILTFDACFPDSIVGFISNPKKSNEIFVHYLLSLYQETLEKNAPQSAQKNINLGILRELLVPKPPITLQNKFAAIAQKIETIKAEQEAQKKVMEELYASITQKVFNDEDFDLSRIPFDASLVPKEEDIVVIEKEVKQQIKLPKEKEKNTKTENYKREEINSKLKGLSWDNISFEYVANAIKSHFHQVYFNAEMLLRYLMDDLGIQVNYFSSAEQKQNQQLENADDFYSFISSAVTGTNAYIQLEQVFYNAVEENIKDIRFKVQDLKLLIQKNHRDRSGIYFRIKDETTTR